MKIADKFRKISDFFAVKMNKAEKEAKEQIKDDNSVKYKASDLDTQDIPNMTSSSIF
jgi:hypothetical protein